jgi:hypothetical protein
MKMNLQLRTQESELLRQTVAVPFAFKFNKSRQTVRLFISKLRLQP